MNAPINHKEWLLKQSIQLNDESSASFIITADRALNEFDMPTDDEIEKARSESYSLWSKIQDRDQERPYKLNDFIIKRLKKEYSLSENGKELAFGVCPSCNKKSLWTLIEKPTHLYCKRTKQCGFSALSKNRVPDLFARLDKDFPPHEYLPTATADVYLAVAKGLDLSDLKGEYSQHNYHHPHGQSGSSTVRFYLGEDRNEYWEQLLDDVIVTHDNGDTETLSSIQSNIKGLMWGHSKQTLDDNDLVYLTDSIFDALTFNANGLKAVAMMGDALPKSAITQHCGKKITWVLALNNDDDSRKKVKRHVQWLREQGEKASALFSSQGTEKINWNDLHQQEKLNDDDLKNYRHYGRLDLCFSHKEKAQLIYDHEEHKPKFFIFDHFNSMYRCTINADAYKESFEELGKTENGTDMPSSSTKVLEGSFHQAAEIAKESNCLVTLLHILVADTGDDPVYCIRVDFENDTPSCLIQVSGSVLSSNSEFTKAIYVKAPGARIKKNAQSHEHMIIEWYKDTLIQVKTLDYAGYNKQADAYIYNDYAIQNGTVIELNEDGYFELKQGGMKTSVDLKQSLTTESAKPWLNDFKTAYGTDGLVVLSWWFGSLFCEQIREDYRSFPFLEIIGEAGSGKTDLETFLWKLMGRDSDNFEPKRSSPVGVMRKLAQLACMPIVFNETDSEDDANNHYKKFSWEDWKDLFNGKIGRYTGQKSNDNSTRNPTFRAALCIIQNIPVFASEAILSRIVHVQFDRSHHTEAGKFASDRLNKLTKPDVSAFLVETLLQDKLVLERFADRYPVHVERLKQEDEVTMSRIIENHAMLMTFAECLPLVIDVDDADIKAVHEAVIKMACTRQEVLKTDSPRVELFWENFEFLNNRFETDNGTIGKDHSINHHPKPDDYVAVNLREYFQLAERNNLDKIPTVELAQILPSSIEHEFMEAGKTIKSNITHKSKRCYIFKTPAKKARDAREAAEKKGRGK